MQLLSWVHFLLNLVGLLLWLKWREEGLQSARRTAGPVLLSTLKKVGTAPVYRWACLGALAGLVLVRALGYWQIGAGVRWTPSLNLVAITIPFRSDLLARMLLFSLASLLVFVAEFYFWLLLLSAVNRKLPDTDPVQNQIRAHLGGIERWPGSVKLLLPFLLTSLAWLGAGPLLAKLSFQLPARSLNHTIEQALLLGLASLLVWKYLIPGLLLLHLVANYVYFGKAPFWTFVNATARHLLKPLSWLPLRAGRLDFAPLVGAALVLLLGETLSYWLPRWYGRLPW